MLLKVIAIGRVGAKPILKTSQTGTVFTRFALATSSTDKKGETHTEWLNCTVFGTLAQTTCQYVETGQLLYIEGTLKTTEYTSDDGEKKKATNCIVYKLQFLGKRTQDNPSTNSGATTGESAPEMPDPSILGDDSIPF